MEMQRHQSWLAALSSASMRSIRARMVGDIVEELPRGAAGEGGAVDAEGCPWEPSLTEWNEAARDMPRREPRRMDCGGSSSS